MSSCKASQFDNSQPELDPASVYPEANTYLLHYLARNGNPTISELEEKVKQFPELVHEVDKAGLTPLHIAARNGHLECFKIILLCSVDEDYDMKEEHESDYIDCCIQDLLDFHTTRSRCNILHSAALSGNIEMVRYLFENMGEETRNKMEKFLFERQKYGKIPAHSAVKSKNIEIFKYLYSKSPALHREYCKTSKGETYIAIAARTGKYEIVNYFFDNYTLFERVEPNVLFENALKGGNIRILNFIEENKEQICTKKSNYLPLHIFNAIESGNEKVVEFLIENKKFENIKFLSVTKTLQRSSPKIDVSPPTYAAYLGCNKIVNYFIDKFDVFSDLFYVNPRSLPIWFVANNFDLFKYLIGKCSNEQKLSTFTVSIEGKRQRWSLFHFATAFCYNDSSFKFLLKDEKLKEFLSEEKAKSIVDVSCLENNVDVLKHIQILFPPIKKYITSKIQLLFKFAARRRHLQTLEYLLEEYGSHLDHSNGDPLCQVATWCKDENFFGSLVTCLTSTNNQTKIQNDALQLALSYGNPITSKILLQLCNIDIISLENFHIFHYAAKGGSMKCLQAVIDTNGDELKEKLILDKKFEFKENGKVTPLHLAVYFQHYDVVSFLLETLQVNPNICDSGFATPLHFACSPNFNPDKAYSPPPDEKIVNLLLDYGAWRSINTSSYSVINVRGSNLIPYDCTTSAKIREILDNRYPNTIKNILLTFSAYNDKIEM